MWFRKYLHVDTLALCFDIDQTSVVLVINRTLPELWRHFQNQIRWPSILQWSNLMGNWLEFPSGIGAIDSTPHQIYKPSQKLKDRFAH